MPTLLFLTTLSYYSVLLAIALLGLLTNGAIAICLQNEGDRLLNQCIFLNQLPQFAGSSSLTS